MAAAIASTGIDVTINTVDHNTFQENFNTYIQQPDDVMTWFAGYRMRAFATKGVVGDITDVWANLPDMSEGFKSASTGLDGKQYFVPFYVYPWAVHYRQSLFDENGYEIPTTWDDFKALCDQMVTDGLIPLAAANDGGWPQMGMFDMLNLRINGYDFHISLMGGKESWTDDRVTDIFTHWSEITDYYQPDVNGRTWQDAATALGNKEVGMYLLGTFVAQQLRRTQRTILDDLTFFPFPEIVAEHGQTGGRGTHRRVHDGGQPGRTRRAPRHCSPAWDRPPRSTPGSPSIRRWSRPTRRRTPSAYNALQQKSVEIVGSAKYIAQFLDRDTEPDFAAQVVGKAIADFLSGQAVDGILATVEEQKQTYTFE